MICADDIRILINPETTADQLFSFYERNDICEKGFGKEIASRVLAHSSPIIGAFGKDRVVDIARDVRWIVCRYHGVFPGTEVSGRQPEIQLWVSH